MGKVKGVNILVKIDVDGEMTVVGGQRGATLNRSSEAIDVTTKDSMGWKENEYGAKEWSVDCDGLFIDNDTAYAKLEDAYMAGTKIDLEIGMPSGTTYSGAALITDFPLEMPYDESVTYSVAFVGDGALGKA